MASTGEKKVLLHRFLQCKLPLNKKKLDLEVTGAFCCYFSQKAKSVKETLLHETSKKTTKHASLCAYRSMPMAVIEIYLKA